MKSIVKIIQNLEENIPKGDDLARGTQEYKDSVHLK